MSRARNLKPGFFQNELLAECDPLARLLFEALWGEADREGRLEDRPKRLKVKCLPYDNCDINELLEQLGSREFILRYEVDEVRYIAIPNFLKHQNPHCKEAPSRIPAPIQGCASTGKAPGEHDAGSVASTVQAPDKHDASTENSGTSPADSLIPSSLIPDSKPIAQQAERRVENLPRSFDRFWSAYPRHVGKQAAAKAFAKITPDEKLLGVMLAALARQNGSEQWLRDGGQFVPHPATWLNGRRWEDEITAARVDRAGSVSSRPSARDSFKDQTYTGTPLEQLPASIRARLEASATEGADV
jgi:hypothetical protein